MPVAFESYFRFHISLHCRKPANDSKKRFEYNFRKSITDETLVGKKLTVPEELRHVLDSIYNEISQNNKSIDNFNNSCIAKFGNADAWESGWSICLILITIAPGIIFLILCGIFWLVQYKTIFLLNHHF